MFATVLGLITGALGALGSFAQTMSQGNMQRQQAAQLRAQAGMERRQAQIEQAQGQAEARRIEARKSELRRAYRDTEAKNRSLLAAGNVDLYSGSASQVSEGNINRFAADTGENYYDRALALWQAEENAKRLRYQASAHSANASYLNKTAANLGTSLLTAAISGAGGFASGYTMAGGSLKSLFGGSGAAAKNAAQVAQPAVR